MTADRGGQVLWDKLPLIQLVPMPQTISALTALGSDLKPPIILRDDRYSIEEDRAVKIV